MIAPTPLAFALLLAAMFGPTGPQEGGPPPDSRQMPMSFEIVGDMEAYQRPTWGNDVDYTGWPEWPLGRVGDAKDFPNKLGLRAIRSEASKVKIDVDGDGTGDVDVPLTGNIAPVRMKIGAGAAARDWGLLLVNGMDKDRYQGFETDRSIRTESGQLFFAPAASVVGMLDKTAIRVLDDNFDGTYGGPPMVWGWVGTLENEPQPEMDSVLIGNSKRARPWSQVQQIDGKWYRFVTTDFGTKFTYWPIEVQTGLLKLEFKGPKPAYVIVQGKDKDNADTYFDLVEGGSSGVALPEGKYGLYFGLLRQGKRREVTKCVILPKKGMEDVYVEAGKTAVLKLGGPFGFDFVATDDGDSITLIGKTVGVTGVGGERYARFWGAAPHPEVSVRKLGGRKAEKTEKTEWITDQDQLVKGWEYCWFPFDRVVPKKLANEKVEVQLYEKKNKLLGELDSGWKETL
jgi:hypothetical protein